ncbi:MAG: DEAD/DEAH box helicase, partial [Burkholderiales bacterium]|nr:DEAD/DEAH box helicase [Burkholderiales bacterium]
HALENPGSALFLQPGLGKTSTTLAVISTLRQHGHIGGTLVIAPLRVAYSVWTGEVSKWAEFNALSVGVLHGPDKAATLSEKHAIYTINPEGLPWLAEALAGFKAWPFDNLVIDESTKFKNATGTRFKIVKKMLPKFKRALLLTGTPCANRLDDLFGQLMLIDNGQRLGKFMSHFHREYFNEKRHPRLGFSEWFPRADTELRIREQIKDVCLFMSAEDYLTMPKLTTNDIMVALPPPVRRIYTQVSKDYFAAVGDASVSAVHAAAAQNKVRQIVGGQVYGDDGVVALHSAKLDALSDLVEEASGQPLLVAVNFKHEAAAIQQMLLRDFKIEAPYLGDGISPAKSDAIANDWNAGKLPVIIAHPASVGHGLNLQAGGNAVVWYTLTWSLEEYDQLNRRVYRQGQEKPVVIHHILATDTVDQDVLEVLQGRVSRQDSFLNPLKRINDGK